MPVRTARSFLALRIVAAVGLVVDAVVHLDLASSQPPAGSGQIDQSTLFRIEGVLALLTAVAIALVDRAWSIALAVLVAGSAFVVVMLSVYVDIGSIGPVPDLYEPAWYASKVISAIGEGVALLAAGVVLVGRTQRGR